MTITVLVDFVNDSITTALAVAEALGGQAVGRAAGHLGPPRRRRAAAALRRGRADGGQRRSSCELTRAALDAHGYPNVKIVVSGGFNATRIAAFEAAEVPVDAYGVGSALIRGSNDFTADIVLLDGRPGGEGGAPAQPEPEADPGSRERHEAHALELPTLDAVAVPAQEHEALLVPADRRDEAPAVGELGAVARGGRRGSAAATLIASNGATSSRPAAPSPTTSVTLSTPAAARFSRARAESDACTSMLHTCRTRRASSAAW